MSMERDVEGAVPYGCGKREPTIPPPTSLCSATSPINGGGKGNGTQAVPYDVNIEPNIRTPREGCPYKGFDKKVGTAH